MDTIQILCINSFSYKVWQNKFTYSCEFFWKKIITECNKQQTEKFLRISKHLLQSMTKRYYKLQQVLQSATIIIKWDLTPLPLKLDCSICCCFVINCSDHRRIWLANLLPTIKFPNRLSRKANGLGGLD